MLLMYILTASTKIWYFFNISTVFGMFRPCRVNLDLFRLLDREKIGSTVIEPSQKSFNILYRARVCLESLNQKQICLTVPEQS